VGINERSDAIGVTGGTLTERIAGIHPQLFERPDPILGGRNRCDGKLLPGQLQLAQRHRLTIRIAGPVPVGCHLHTVTSPEVRSLRRS